MFSILYNTGEFPVYSGQKSAGAGVDLCRISASDEGQAVGAGVRAGGAHPISLKNDMTGVCRSDRAVCAGFSLSQRGVSCYTGEKETNLGEMP